MGRTEAHEGLTPPEVIPGQGASKSRARKKRAPKKRTGNMVIVESPAKARTIGNFLGKGFKVHASIGHVRDLLRSQLSVDTDDNFKPRYRVPNEKRQVVKDLKAAASVSEAVFIATDPDREGEAIAWHLLEAAEIEPERAKRVVFHEITRDAIDKAFEDTRTIDMNLVDAQQARRILDRLVGYNLSPLLWTKVRGRLSAGRVQSVALRMIVDRENEIRAFEAQEYWTIDAELMRPQHPPAFRAKLRSIDDEKAQLESESAVEPIIDDMRRAEYKVSGQRRSSRTRKPQAPFITSTLQQAASRRLGYSARRTMALAQQLYEGIEISDSGAVGLITYMRSDSTHVAAQAVNEARRFIGDVYGGNFLPEQAPTYRTRARSAQEAHEAIRPTSVMRTPEATREFLKPEQQKLYAMIWQRFVASQMNPAKYNTLRVDVVGETEGHTYGLRLSASSLKFEGFLKVYADHKKERNRKEDESDVALMDRLPELEEGARLELVELHPEQHFTQPPARYSEATLVRALEEHGIGRPSTYAPILGTLQQRGYVVRERRRLSPTEIGEVVNGLLVEHFPNIVDMGFTARMEGQLDDIARGQQNWVEVVRAFYDPFADQIERAVEHMPEVKTEPEALDRLCPEDGGQLLIRHGRFGRFVGCSNFPACRYTEPWLEKIGVTCPLDGGDLVQRRTRKGRTFYGCANYPKCEFTSWKRPLGVACKACGGMIVREGSQHASCKDCGERFSLEDLEIQVSDLA
jgi:DNA topoisomerase-1